MATDVGESFESMLRKVFREELKAVAEAQDDRLLTAEQAAEILGYSNIESVRRLAREGHLDTVSLGENTRRYRNSDVQRLVQQGIAVGNGRVKQKRPRKPAPKQADLSTFNGAINTLQRQPRTATQVRKHEI